MLLGIDYYLIANDYDCYLVIVWLLYDIGYQMIDDYYLIVF